MEIRNGRTFVLLVGICMLSGELVNSYRQISPVNSLEKNALQRFNNHETSHRNVGSLSQCGNKAVYHGHRSRRSTKAFVWENDVVTWGFEKFSRKLERILQWKIFRKALRTWSRYSNLRFKYTRKRPDIRILFARYEHGDGDYNAFDGQGRTIGHAFRPKNGGTHFDDDELWSVSTILSTGEIHLPTAALHEIGHAIGLEHVSDYSSVMSAYFTTPKAKPSALDIAQLRDLYSRRKPRPPATNYSKKTMVPYLPPSKKELNEALDNCNGIRDIIMLQNGNKRRMLQIFAGNITFRVSSTGRELAFPKWTSRVFHGVPGDVDAASYYQKTQAQYFFKGDQVWKLKRRQIEFGYPKTVKLHTLFEKPRASVVVKTWHSSGLFIFGNRTFWEWSPWRDNITATLPRPISRHWRGLPDNIDSAVQWKDQYVYFFKGSKYYKVHPSRRMVLYGYPKSMPPPWLTTFCNSSHL
uniref:Peptidase metallopeptidase domain-containing protein n=1 Tax=Magallana gigas TaxID=29159 RepID=A0A8W8NB89_MAGGI|nr:matrix metalloproteinase-19 [Crassostrea gigas]